MRISVSNISCNRLIRAIKKVKKLNKSVRFFCVIIILRNHYFAILKLFWAVNKFILSKMRTTVKSGNMFTTYGKFTDAS